MSKIICIASGKGGVGKSSVSLGLCSALATRGKRTLLIDTDLTYGYDHVLLGVEPQAYVQDVFSSACQPQHALNKIHNNLYVMCSNNTGGDYKNFERLIKGVYGLFDYIILDLPAGDIQHVFTRFSSYIFVVEPRAASVSTLTTLKASLSPLTKIKLVVNKITKDDCYSVSEIKKLGDYDLLGVLASNKDFTTLGKKNVDIRQFSQFKYFLNMADRLENPSIPMIQVKKSWWNNVAVF